LDEVSAKRADLLTRGGDLQSAKPGLPTGLDIRQNRGDDLTDLRQVSGRHGLLDPAPTLCDLGLSSLPVGLFLAGFFPERLIQEALFFSFRQSHTGHRVPRSQAFVPPFIVAAKPEKTKWGPI
jgi:hypothetical protein